MRVRLVNRTRKDTHVVELKQLKKGEWAEATADFNAGSGKKPRAGDRVDEVHFLLPAGAELLVDDVLLYEPGEKPREAFTSAEEAGPDFQVQGEYQGEIEGKGKFGAQVVA